MRTTYLLNIIIVFLAFAMSLFSIITPGFPYSGNSVCSTSYKLVLTENKDTDQKDLVRSVEKYLGIEKVPADDKVQVGEEKTALTGPTAMTESFYYEMGDVRLIGEEGSLKENVLLSINGLDTNILPPLNAGMVNVTADFAAYRMLPHGTIFNKDIEVVLPYDTTLLPMGFTPNDIKSYYYDERYGSWIEIERDSVDMVNHLIISRVNHFTDFINAVIKTPEMPETSAYVPTVMSDIKAANPLEGINLMQPPTANNNGTANLSYPLEIPAGRNGMQPNLALTYNSGGGNGWLGVGWDISIPAITVETRWGVPKYDASKESEVYLLNGEQLATKDTQNNYNPLVYRTNFVNRMNGDVQFYPKTEGAFQKIIRHGNSPKNYWWEVRDKNGMIYYYGKQLSSNQKDDNAVLRDYLGNIAKWGLTEMRDLNGNFVYYTYDVTSLTEINKYMYVKEITYTGFNTTQGKYRIAFQRQPKDTFNCSDKTVNCRYGFKEVNNDLLQLIKIYYDNSLYKGYSFCYEEGAFGKSLLTRITEPTDSLLNANVGHIRYCGDSLNILMYEFSYYEKPDTIFGPEKTIDTKSNNVGTFLTKFAGDLKSSIGGTYSSGWSIGGTLAVGFGTNIFSKNLSVGGNYTYSRNNSKGILTLIDIDGDGLPDKVFKLGNSLYYRRMFFDNGSYKFSNSAIPITGVSDFQKEQSKTNDWGLEGHVGAGDIMGSVSYNRGSTKSSTLTYFCDVDADGYPDIVNKGNVFYNKKNSTGGRTFTPVVTDTVWVGGSCGSDTNFIMQDEVINTAIFTPGDTIHSCFLNIGKDTVLTCINTVIPGFDYYMPDLEAVRVWIAPRSGLVKLTGNAILTQDLDSIRNLSGIEDGVKISVQYNGTLVKSQIIKSDSIFVLNNQIFVTKGARLYFRMESLDSRLYDKVYWDPQIAYNYDMGNISNYDADGKNNHVYKASEDFLVSNKQKLQMPFSGNVYIKNNFTISDSLSADIVMKIYKNGNILYQRIFPKKNTATFNFDTLVPVSKGDSIDFKLTSYSNVKWNSVRWIPRVYYDTIISPDTIPAYEYETDTNLATPTVEYSPIPYFGVFERTLIPTKAYKFANNVNASISPTLTFSSSVYGIITLSIKSNIYGEELKKSYIVSNGQVSVTLPLPIIPIYSNRIYYIDYYTDNIALAEALTNIKCKINGSYYNAGLHTHYPDSMYKFGNLYRNWGQFTYQKLSNGVLINESLLNLSAAQNSDSLDESQIDTNNYQNLDSQFSSMNCYDPLATNFIPMEPNVRENYWSGYGGINYVSADTMSNTYDNSVDTTVIDLTESPIPIVAVGEKIRAVNKMTFGVSNAVSLSGTLGPVSGGGGFNWGYNIVQSDYMDMNGDRYPDVISKQAIQYSKPQGGLSNFYNGFDYISAKIDSSRTKGWGVSFGGDFMKLNKESKNNPKSNISYISGNSGYSHSEDIPSYTHMDINGDGLPDKILNDGKVYFNLGYTFCKTPVDYSSNLTIRKGYGESISMSMGLGFNLWGSSISGGFGGTGSTNSTKIMLVDINGDGLPDKVNNSDIEYNNGNGFEPVQSLNIETLSKGKSMNKSINIAITVGIPILLVKLVINPKGSISWGLNQTQMQLADMNADGYPDFVTYDNNTPQNILVKYNQIGKTNLLKKVQNLAGGSFTIGYKLSDNSVDCPQRILTMSSLMVEDGYIGDGVDTLFTTFEYDSAYYDRFDRENMGFGIVKTFQKNIRNTGDYRLSTEKYYNREAMRKGLKYYELLTNANNNKYVEKFYNYKLKEIETGNRIPSATAFCYGEGYPALDEEIIKYYEGGTTAQITSIKKYDHGPYGNVKAYHTYNIYGNGNSYDPSDSIYAVITYHTCNSGKNLVGIPTSITVKGNPNTVLRYRECTIDTNTGKITRIKIDNDGYYSVYDLSYNAYGNVDTFTLPQNANGERMFYHYTYDPAIHTYPLHIENALGYHSSATYSYYWGKPLSTTDINGNTIQYTYDFRGRPFTIKGPYENDYTLKFTYFNVNHFSVQQTLHAVTEHYDTLHPDNPMITIVFVDGLNRVIQTKKNIDIDGTEYNVVSGKVEYDAFGRVVKSYYPIYEPNEISIINQINQGVDNLPPTIITYDFLDRKNSVILPDASTTTMSYGFGTNTFGKTQFRTITTDANGNSTTVYNNARQLQTSAQDPLGNATSFEYNALGELILSIDPAGNSTTYAYDRSGRRIFRNHPDAGVDTMQYDPAGNIITHQTQNLQNAGNTWIEYEYNYNQLINIKYPENPENNVFYEYGAMGDPNNRAGKIVRQEDASGYQEFSYGALGEITENIRTFVLPNENETYTFAMNFEYDSWNRILNMTYPDGELVNYEYNLGGQLKRMTGTINGQFWTYIDSINYNKFEAKTGIYYGNGTNATYDYDILQRLEHLVSQTSGGEIMQDINYTFDGVNNITQIVNVAGTLQNGLGGYYESSYSYDNIYRLTKDSGYWDNGASYGYELELDYSPDGRILQKTQTASQLINGVQTSISYDNTYTYNGMQPHALSHVDDNGYVNQDFEWDANGNLITHDHELLGSRKLCWDEENRIMGVGDENFVSYYMYDAGGERTYKLTGAFQDMIINGQQYNYNLMNNATLYASPYLVATPQGYTKHYYAGSERILSKIGGGGLSTINTTIVDNVDIINEKIYANYGVLERTVNQCLKKDPQIIWDNLTTLKSFEEIQNDEQDFYYYHPDHLGSGTWITYTDGSAIQHLHYLPFGEEQIDQRLTNFNSRYTFSAKEKDIETNYSYFGARYYNSDLSIWLSVDPLSDKYPHQSNYVYCSNNPIKLIDPNGEDEYEFDKKGNYLRTITNDKVDRLVIVNNNGKKTNSKDFQYGTFDGYFCDGDNGKDENGNTIMDGMTKSDARKTFNFMADNTDVEWGYLQSKGEHGTSNFIVGTSHTEDFEGAVSEIARDASINGGVIRYDHGHGNSRSNTLLGHMPSNERTSSNPKYNDELYYKDILKGSPNATFGIRFQGKTNVWFDKGVKKYQ